MTGVEPLRRSGANNAHFDSETGLYKMGARYYRPEVGRWITRDKVGGVKTAPTSQQRYAYAEGNPVRHSDPTGYWIKERHFEMTFWSARAARFSYLSSLRIARGSYSADGAPGVQGLSERDGARYHFDYTRGAGKRRDSRYQFLQYKTKRAVRLWRKGLRSLALYHLGLGLHAFPQDYYAHGYIRFRQHRNWGKRIESWSWRTQVSAPDSTRWRGRSDYRSARDSRTGINYGYTVGGGTDHGWPGYGRRYLAASDTTDWVARRFVARI